MHPLEPDAIHLPMTDRLARAAERIDAGDGVAPPGSTLLRPDQAGVFEDLARFLREVANAPSGSPGARVFGRVVLPPRTGKTVVAGHLIARSGLCSTFIVPTKALVDQITRELSARLPGVSIGQYFSESRSLVEHGVNVTTYSILLRDHARGALPPPLARSALVFVDEAHRAMTDDRIDMLRHGFAAGAVRVALTATPTTTTRGCCAGSSRG